MSVKLASRPGRTRPIIMAAVLALAGLLAAAGQAASARAATVRTEHAAAVTGTGPAKPAIVLVHGAWADSGSWNAVIGLLQRAGYTVYAPPNPLEGLAIDTATLADFLHSSFITGPIVLVGHSYGGEVITNAATGDSQVKALVYDDAYLPKQGEDLVDLTKPGSCFAVQDRSTVFNFVHDPVSPSGAVAYVKPAVFPGCFANGLPASAGAVLAATQRPLATSTFTDQSGVPAWQTIPSWDVVGTADHIITPAEQLFMANRAHAHITEINAPHLSMITDPGVVASVIIQAARATS